MVKHTLKERFYGDLCRYVNIANIVILGIAMTEDHTQKADVMILNSIQVP